MLALEKSFEFGDKIPVGLFYKSELPDLASGLALPKDGKLRNHETDRALLQNVVNDLTL
jgi:hypothetical protein